MISRPLAAWIAVALAAGCSPAPSADTGGAQATQPAPPLVPAMPRMRVLLMSSLPLVHGDGVDMAAMLAGQSDPHPLHEDLASAHDLVVADALDADVLADTDLAILLQPRALPPQALVALDAYVRRGGRLLLFTDPMLEWHGGKGLGDPLGPERIGMLSPLLSHWGLAMVDPELKSVIVRPSGAMLVHPGVFVVQQGKNGPGKNGLGKIGPGKNGDAACRIETGGAVAHCRAGQGRATLVADADLLDPAIINQSAESGQANRRFVSGLIADLMRKDTS